MSFELAIRLTEIMLAFAFIQQSIEHLYISKNDKLLFGIRLILSFVLMAGFWSQWVCIALIINALFFLNRFQGPYNGGSDRMGILILCCLGASHFMPTQQWSEYILGYLAMQLILSYFIAGWVKIKNPEWRNGRALHDVFSFSAYPVSETLRGWVSHPKILLLMGWGVMVFELIFPLTFMTQATLLIGLVIAGLFHFANACLFGLNRFFWFWLAAYPSIIWLQDRLIM
jgi:hypothetical protein